MTFSVTSPAILGGKFQNGSLEGGEGKKISFQIIELEREQTLHGKGSHFFIIVFKVSFPSV